MKPVGQSAERTGQGLESTRAGRESAGPEPGSVGLEADSAGRDGERSRRGVASARLTLKSARRGPEPWGQRANRQRLKLETSGLGLAPVGPTVWICGAMTKLPGPSEEPARLTMEPARRVSRSGD